MTGRARRRLVLARHAESAGNVAGLWQGQSGLGLTCRGLAQAAALAQRLADEASLAAVVCSDQRRALETVAPLRRQTSVPCDGDARWRELDVGTWAGRPVAEVRQREPERFAAFWQGRAPAGGDGETVGQLRTRVREALVELQHGLAEGATAVVVTHGWALRAAVGELAGLADGDECGLGGVGNAALCVLELAAAEPGAPWQVTAYDDRSHLPAQLRARPDRRAA